MIKSLAEKQDKNNNNYYYYLYFSRKNKELHRIHK